VDKGVTYYIRGSDETDIPTSAASLLGFRLLLDGRGMPPRETRDVERTPAMKRVGAAHCVRSH
jgi:hypothetical protein